MQLLNAILLGFDCRILGLVAIYGVVCRLVSPSVFSANLLHDDSVSAVALTIESPADPCRSR